MGKYKYSEKEKEILRVCQYQQKELSELTAMLSDIEERDACTKAVLRSRGYEDEVESAKADHSVPEDPQVLVVSSWKTLCKKAEQAVGDQCELEDLFTPEELAENSRYIRQLNEEYNELHRMDWTDYTISVLAGILAGAVDILMVGIPAPGKDGVEAGPLSDWIRRRFDKAFPQEEMEKLAHSRASKVPYDAQDNRNTSVHIEGLSAYYHRLLSLGHDPLLGFVVGVFDIMTGRMTTIDKNGKLVSQVMEYASDRKETNLFQAILKQILHLKSDVTTSMGLPAPLMSLFQLFQFGSIGEEEQTIAELVQGMYYEGYDFIHFCSMSIPVMLEEVMVRACYYFKRIHEGHSPKESIPCSLKREKHPKLATMLFLAHSVATAINAGKVCFTENPMAINYPQWLAFAKSAFQQLKGVLAEKPELRERYVMGKIGEESEELYQAIEASFEEFSEGKIVVFEA